MHFWRRLQTSPGFQEPKFQPRLRLVHFSGAKVMTRGDKLFKDARSSLQRVLAGPEDNCPSNFRSLGCSMVYVAMRLKMKAGLATLRCRRGPRHGVVAVC